MSAYLKFFQLEQSPFEGKAQSQVVLGTRALRDAFTTIREGLEEGSARICLSGGAGLGKTSLARALPKLLADTARVAVVLDPSLAWDSLRGSIAKQWGLESGGLPRAGLLEAARTRRLVLVIDQAENATEEFLDYLDVLLSYRSENDEPVVQSVLLARLAVGPSRDPVPLIWWLDRIQTLQVEFTPLPRDGVESYIRKHLKRAGWKGGDLFTLEAALAIHGYTGGIPGDISALCERLLTRAADQQLIRIDDEFVHAIYDVEDGHEDLVLADEVQPLSQTLERFGLDDSAPESFEEDEPFELDEVVDTTCGAPLGEGFGESFDEPFDPEASDFVGATSDGRFADEVEGGSDLEALFSIEDDLSRPASPEELRAILGSVFAQHARAIAVAALAALIGGLFLFWLRTPAAAPTAPVESFAPVLAPGAAAGPSARFEPTQVGTRAEDTARRATDSPEPVLARVRGPVLTTASSETAVDDETSDSADSGNPGTPSTVDDDDDVLEDELIDLRPTALIPESSGAADSAVTR